MLHATSPIVLGEGIVQVDDPYSLAPEDYRFDDALGLCPSEAFDRYDIEFPAAAAGASGTLIAVVTQPPRRPGFIDARARAGARSPRQGEELTLGTGTARLRRRTAGGRPVQGERTAIGLDVSLDGAAVRSVLGIWVALKLVRDDKNIETMVEVRDDFRAGRRG